METKDTGEEEMERNNWSSQNSQRVVELKKKKKKKKKKKMCFINALNFFQPRVWLPPPCS